MEVKNCNSVTLNGKKRYFKPGTKAGVSLGHSLTYGFAPLLAGFLLFWTLLFSWVFFKNTGGLKWISFLLAASGFYNLVKTLIKYKIARDYINSNTSDTCDQTPVEPKP